jgi:hypothetical protein
MYLLEVEILLVLLLEEAVRCQIVLPDGRRLPTGIVALIMKEELVPDGSVLKS